MRFPKQVVMLAIGLRCDGLSLERARFRVSKFFGILVKACSTIWRWFIRFVEIRSLGKLLHADETKLKSFWKGFFFILWAIKCPKTKAIVGWHISILRKQKSFLKTR